MAHGDVVDEFLNQHRLADTCTAEETNLTTATIGRQQVNDLNTCDEDFCVRALIREGGRFAVACLS